MTKKLSLLVTTTLLFVSMVQGTAALAAGPADRGLPVATTAKHRLVIQVSEADPKRWNLALNNARNIQQDLGRDNVEIEIVAYGPGIGMLKADSEVASRLIEASSDGVKLAACENTMKAQKLSPADMHIATGFVPSGVVELMLKQEQGYAYLRP